MTDDELNQYLADDRTATMTASEDLSINLPEATVSDSDEFDIVVESMPRVGFVKRWTQKIVGWVKRLFNWRKD